MRAHVRVCNYIGYSVVVSYCCCFISSDVLQKADGMTGRHTRPYIIDLGSANGTFVNNKQIESQR